MKMLQSRHTKEMWSWSIGLNLLAVCAYFFLIRVFGFPEHLGEIILNFPDARSYHAAGLQVLGEPHSFTAYDPMKYRPFLFPVILTSLLSIGPMAFWGFQFLCWLVLVNGLFRIALNMGIRKPIAFLASVAVVLNAGVIGFSLHGLTELISLALLTLYFLVLSADTMNSRKYLLLVFIASLLTVTRPVFSLLILLTIILLILAHENPKVKTSWLALVLLLVLSLSPVIIQLGLNYFHYHEVFISRIGSGTFRNHLAAQVVADVMNIGPEAAQTLVWKMDGKELLVFLFENFTQTLRIYFHNVVDSFWNYSYSVNFPEYHNRLTRYSLLWNQAAYLAFSGALIYVIFIHAYQRKIPGAVIILAIFVSLLVIFTAGISYGEGDRLTITSVMTNFLVIAYTMEKVLTRAER